MSLQSKAGTEVSQISYPLIGFIIPLPSFTCHSLLFHYYYWEALRHCEIILTRTQETKSFPGGSDSKESVCNAGEPGLIPGLERSPEEGNSNPLRYSCLGKSYGHRSLVGFVRGVTKNQAGLSMDASLSIQPSIYPSTCLFIYHLSIYLPIHPSTCSSSRCYYTPTHPAIH